MENNKGGAEALCEIDCLESLFDRAIPFFLIRRGKLITVGRRPHDFHRERTKVVQTAKAHLAGIKKFLDAGHERNANAMSEFDHVKTETLDFKQHLFAIGM